MFERILSLYFILFDGEVFVLGIRDAVEGIKFCKILDFSIIIVYNIEWYKIRALKGLDFYGQQSFKGKLLS